MSLINKMLQDLDARGTTRADGVPPEIKTVTTGGERMPVLRIAAISAAVLVTLMGAAAWFIFPIKGKTYDVQPVPPAVPAPAQVTAPVTVAEVAPAPAIKAEPAPVPVPREEVAPKPPAAAPAASEKPAPAPRKAAPAPVKEEAVAPAPVPRQRPAPPAGTDVHEGSTTSWAVASERARAEQERLERRWKSEERRLAKLPPAQRRDAERKLREEQAQAAARVKIETAWLASLKRKEAAGGLPNAEAAPPAATRGQGRVETGSQSAENAYRRALVSLQEGRVSEAITGLQTVLRAAPRHEAARQTLVSLLIENNRGDEAMTQLQQALTLDPRQPALAMLLARLQIERGKSGIEVLTRTLPYAAGNGDYHAFLGGALQRQGRLREAAEQYQTALRITPGNAVWWMGLGIALQGDKRNPEAAEAFRQAKALGSLTPELQAFVERRLGQLGR